MAQMWISSFFHKFSVKWTIDTVAIGQKIYWAFVAGKKMMPACFIFTSWTVSWNAESKRDVLVAMPVTHIPHLKVTRDRWFELISTFKSWTIYFFPPKLPTKQYNFVNLVTIMWPLKISIKIWVKKELFSQIFCEMDNRYCCHRPKDILGVRCR